MFDAVVAVWETLYHHYGNIGEAAAPSVKGTSELAITAIEALRSLPVETRMAVMGMVLYGEVTWDDEEDSEVVVPVIDDCAPGAYAYVDERFVG